MLLPECTPHLAHCAGLVARLEDELKMNEYLATEKLPHDVRQHEEMCQEMEAVISQPTITSADLDCLHEELRALKLSNNKLVEERMISTHAADGKLALFRQQASIIAKRKAATAEKLKDAQDELAALRAEIEAKKADGNGAGPRMPKADEVRWTLLSRWWGCAVTDAARAAEAVCGRDARKEHAVQGAEG